MFTGRFSQNTGMKALGEQASLGKTLGKCGTAKEELSAFQNGAGSTA